MKKAAFLLLSALMIVTLFSCAATEEEIVDVEHITSQTSPDGLYTVSLYQIGTPEWSFGPVKAKLVLCDADGKMLDEERFSLLNDGTDVYEGNIEQIHWKKDKAEVLMGESDTTQTYTYSLEYDR